MISSLIFYLLGMLAVIQIRGDGYFPFPKSWPQEQLLLIVLIHTLFLVASILCFAYFLISGKNARLIHIPEQYNMIAIGVFPLFALATIVALHIMQANYFQYIRPAEYRLDLSVVALFSALSLVPLGVYWLWSYTKKTFSPRLFLLSVLGAALLIRGIPLALFPVTAKRSDMLPMLKEVALSLFYGGNIYQYHLLDNGVWTPNVRLPGLVTTYIPAAITGMDLRWVTLICEMTIFLILIFQLKLDLQIKNRSWGTIWAITLFLLFPYWHYRHELYESPFWLLLLGSLFALDRGRAILFSLCTGAMMGFHQWGWLFAPYLFIALYHVKGWKVAALGGIGSIILGMLILATGIGSHVPQFYVHVFGTYGRLSENGSFYPMSMYLTPHLAQLGLTRWLYPIQFILQIPLLAIAWRHALRTEAVAGVLALSLTVQLLFNPVAWTYQYLLVIFLLILGLYFREEHSGSEARVSRRT